MYRESQDTQNKDMRTSGMQNSQQSYENFCPNIGQQYPFLAQGIDPSMTRQRYGRHPYYHNYYPYYHHHYHHHHHY